MSVSMNMVQTVVTHVNTTKEKIFYSAIKHTNVTGYISIFLLFVHMTP